MKKLLVVTLLSTALAGALAKDLGVQGTVFPIVEVDMRQLFREQLEKVDGPRITSELKTSASRYVDSLPKRVLPTVGKTTTALVDLSVTLSSPIQAPVKQADGTWKWQILYPAGTRVNPLDSHRPTKAMLFIDGSQPDQLALAKQLISLAGSRLHVVEAGQGSILEDNKVLKIPTYYGDDKLMARFQVTALPSLLFAGEGDQKAFMALTSFGRPFKVEDGAGWNVVRTKLAAADKEKKK